MKRKSLLLAILTTVLWSGSYIMNKLAFREGIGPLTLSGLRYLLASGILFLPSLCKGRGGQKQGPPLKAVLLLGILGYAAAQGLQYVGQSYLTPTQSSLFLSVGNTAFVLLADRFWLRENQGWGDLAGMLLMAGGIALYYAPFGGAALSGVGMLFMALSSLGYALHLNFNRALLRGAPVRPRLLAAGPMFFGSVVLLAAGLALEGLPVLTGRLLLILAYLSGVSGALGFYLWTTSQSGLSAFESSSINNLMMIEIALLDLVVFGRSFSAVQAAAVLLVFCSVLFIQFRKRRPRAKGRPLS
ncbi:MAG: DMT family transporter [Eubacteriales bacterium]|nr:DMT family transporter [Eubacteriales bacterium]